MMTKADFQMVAASLRVQVNNLRTVREIVEASNLHDTVTKPKAVTLETTSYDLAQRFAFDNPRFDHETFYKACGFEIRDNWPVVFPDDV